jgi:hypothetical protein
MTLTKQAEPERSAKALSQATHLLRFGGDGQGVAYGAAPVKTASSESGTRTLPLFGGVCAS